MKKRRYAVSRAKPKPSIMLLLNLDGLKRQLFRSRLPARRHAHDQLGTRWVHPRHR
jgi:hypothetical protein